MKKHCKGKIEGLLLPMSSFDPSKPALLYDELNDEMLEWTADPDKIKHWKQYAEKSWNQTIWDGLLLTGWRPVE